MKMFDILTYIMRTMALIGIPAGLVGILREWKGIVEAWKR